jgi:hypothetical protein
MIVILFKEILELVQVIGNCKVGKFVTCDFRALLKTSHEPRLPDFGRFPEVP